MTVSNVGGLVRSTPVDAQAPRAPELRPPVGKAAAPDPLSLSNAALAARAMAAAPPVDTAKIESIRAAIAAGTYAVDPERIAEKMLALDLPPR